MKGSKGIYILLPVVLVIWVLIGFRVVKYLSSDKPVDVKANLPEMKFDEQNILEDTFSILANYRDPFLGTIKSTKTTVNNSPMVSVKKPVVPTPKPVERPVTPYPKVIFRGLVRNNNSNKAFALISLDGKSKTVAEKEEINGLKILSITRDSIITSFSKQVVSFRKK